MKSGGGVLCVSGLSLICGLCLLGIYEGYKTHFFNNFEDLSDDDDKDNRNAIGFSTPLDGLFWFATANNIFAIFGLVGIIAAQKEMVIAFFVYNIAQMVLAFNWFVDVCADLNIRFVGEADSLNPYEKAAAAFLFFVFALSVTTTFFAMRAVQELREKQRELYNVSALSDALQFEPDS